MSTPEIDPETAESMEQDADIRSEPTEPTYHAQEPHPEATDEEAPDHGGMPTA